MFRASKAISAFVSPRGGKLSKWLLQKCRLAPNTAAPFSSFADRPQVPSEKWLNISLGGISSEYIQNMYDAWVADPSSVHVSWDSCFRNLKSEDERYQSAHYLAPLSKNDVQPTSFLASLCGVEEVETNYISEKIRYDDMALQALIISYQSKGHYKAKLDPLGMNQGTLEELEFTEYGFEEADLDRVFYLPPTTFIGGKGRLLSLREILRRLESTYCGHIATEYIHIKDKQQCNWIRQRLETPEFAECTIDEKKLILARLIRATEFESFLARKWPTEKRFGLEGCEVLIPAMKQIIDKSTELGVDSFVMGMPHRGRLNVLANVCRQPLHQMFVLFGGLKGDDKRSGDVKYHLGSYVERLNRVTNKNIKMALLANPSHLEAVNPVVHGRTRAEQFCRGDDKGKKVMSILLHGDAAFSGQGIVTESMNMSNLPNYTNHGTIHIIANNQIGFTTDPCHSRSSTHCTANGRVVDAPIFHVNADDPESVMKVCNIAAEWRNTFHKDVIIDLVSYRRNGHNEMDEPMFTQPLMYRKIMRTKPVLVKYSEKLINEGVMTQEEIQDVKEEYEKICEKDLTTARKETHITFKDWSDKQFSGSGQKDPLKIGKTGLEEKTLVHIGKCFSSPPPNAEFVISKGIVRTLKGRMDMIKNRQIDWALGEALAFGSLLKEGIHVRLSGQDVERGTFCHRHHVLQCQNSNVTYRPLSNLYPNQASYTVCNSPLSEYAVLGFELGYSVGSPNSLVMWEAQFGDFHNTAQAIIDQFISSGETKWGLQTSLVMLLPHGLDGMGSEHSSARLERFLQMSSESPNYFPEPEDLEIRQLHDNNWIVANCTTPANLFHILRRQIALPFRKPLILMTPKSLLRHPEARSSFDDILENTEFQRIIPDHIMNPDGVKKVLFCTGQVYYDLKKMRDDMKLQKEIAIIRIEQISPFPFDLVQTECAKYPNAHLCFVQEEHENQGAWSYVQPRFKTALSQPRDISSKRKERWIGELFSKRKSEANDDRETRMIRYIGRPSASSTATGIKAQHLEESVDVMADAMAL